MTEVLTAQEIYTTVRQHRLLDVRWPHRWLENC